jgi:hypothetical protein
MVLLSYSSIVKYRHYQEEEPVLHPSEAGQAPNEASKSYMQKTDLGRPQLIATFAPNQLLQQIFHPVYYLAL